MTVLCAETPASASYHRHAHAHTPAPCYHQTRKPLSHTVYISNEICSMGYLSSEDEHITWMHNKCTAPNLKSHHPGTKQDKQIDPSLVIAASTLSKDKVSVAVHRGHAGVKRGTGESKHELQSAKLCGSVTWGGVGVDVGLTVGGVGFLLPPPDIISSVMSLPPWFGSRMRI